MSNNKAIGVAFADPALIAGTTIDGAVITNSTVSGASFTNPALGTPTSGVLTNCTGLPVSTGISGLGTGVAAFLATPSSANLATALTDETGSGAAVFANTPTLVTPTLGAANATSINFGGSALSTYANSTAWTPVITFTTPGDLAVVYSTQIGRYMQIGKLIIATFAITTTTFTFTTASGNLRITGLPVASENISEFFMGACSLEGYTKANFTQVAANLGGNASLIQFLAGGSGQVSALLTAADMATGTNVTLRCTIAYFVA